MKLRQLHTTLASSWGFFLFVILLYVVYGLCLKNYDSIGEWICFLSPIAIALLLKLLVRTYSFIREKSFLPCVFYLLLVASDPGIEVNFLSEGLSLILILTFFLLFALYQQPESQRNALFIGILITVGSLFWQPLLYLFPIFWYAMYKLKGLNIRSLLASIFAYPTVFLFIATWSLYQNDWTILTAYLPQPEQFFFVDINLENPLIDWISVGFVVVLILLSAAQILQAGISEKVKTLVSLRTLLGITCCLFVLAFLQNTERAVWQQLVYLPLSLLLGYFFTTNKSKGATWLLLFTLFFLSVLPFADYLITKLSLILT